MKIRQILAGLALTSLLFAAGCGNSGAPVSADLAAQQQKQTMQGMPGGSSTGAPGTPGAPPTTGK